MSFMTSLPRSPRRLRAGVALLATLATGALAGPWFAGSPTAILDPGVAGLLPPGSEKAVVIRRDGTTLAGESLRRSGPDWVITRAGADVTVPGTDAATAGVRRFWLGTDTVGRDVLARLVSGARVSLGVGALALAVALVLGVGAGLLAGWAGGLVDAFLMRLVDALLAVPMLFLLLFLAALFRPSLAVLVLFLGFSSWMGVARLVRGQVLSLKERDFVLAARALGRARGASRSGICSRTHLRRSPRTRRSASEISSSSRRRCRSSASASSRRRPRGARWSPRGRRCSPTRGG